MRFLIAITLVATSCVATAWADTRGVIGGRVTDPQNAAVSQASVALTNKIDGRRLETTTDDEGSFEFRFVNVGEYTITVASTGFSVVSVRTVVTSGQRVEINFTLKEIRVAGEEVNVTSTQEVLDPRGSSITTGFSMTDVSHLAGASESTAGLEAHTGTAWRSQEHLHIRGAHQIGYQINGINIPDLSIFGAITPFIDPRNIKFTEVTTGGLAAEYGNRTAGIVNTLVRSGFDHGYGRGEIELSGGNLSRGSIFANFGSHRSEKFAYYVQGTALTSGRGFNPPPDSITPLDLNKNGRADVLDEPGSQSRHNYRRTFQGFTNLEWRPTSQDAFNFVMGAFRSDFQVPNTLEQQSFGRDYIQLERDQFQNLQWTRVMSSARLLTIGLYHHFTKLETDGRADDPSNPLASDNRRANYYGGKADFIERTSRHLMKLGVEIYDSRLNDDFGLLPNPANPQRLAAPVASRVPSRAIEESVYAQDQFDATDRLTLSCGVRADFFQARYDLRTRPHINEEYAFVSPRIGFAYRLGKRDAVLFGNFAYLFLPPPIEFFELPNNSGAIDGFSFTPVKPEKDVQYDIGLKFAVRRFRVRVNQWFKRQNGFLDHLQLASLSGTGELINPNIFLPVNLDRARTYGLESFVEAPAYRGLRIYVNYSLNYAQAVGGVINGFNDGSPPERSYFFLDHDQRHQVYVGADYQWEKLHAFANASYAFGSGFPDASDSLFGQCVTRNCRLPAHSVVNLAFGKVFANRVEGKIEIEDITNSVYPINLGSEFNGSHFSAPRLAMLRLAYRF
ncbi:MAG TPA: TonB-dependent receptor [Blastocatellia bacterium]|nr:TonB-dependent receptor [Blastocatellia bacterium]